MELTPIIQPGQVKGFSSAIHPTTLPESLLAEMQNIRIDDGTAVARDGDTSLITITSSDTEVRGVGSGLLDGVMHVFVALGDGTHADCYKSASPNFVVTGSIYSVTAAENKVTRSTDTFTGLVVGMWITMSGWANEANNVTAQVESFTDTTIVFEASSWNPVDEAAGEMVTLTSWVNITPEPEYGPYENLRLTDAADRPVWFTLVKDRARPAGVTAYDLLIIQNGVDSPRIHGRGTTLSSSGSYATSIVTQPSLPQAANLVAITAFTNNFLLRESSHYYFPDPTGDGLSFTTVSNWVALQLDASDWDSPSASIFSGLEGFSTYEIDFSEAKQLVMVARNSNSGRDPEWYRKLTVGLSDGTENAIVYDPSSVTGNVLAIPMPGSDTTFHYELDNASITATFRTLTRASGTFTGLSDGMWIEVVGFANGGNNGWFQVYSFTETTIVFTAETMTSPTDESAGPDVTLHADDSTDGTKMLVYPIPGGSTVDWKNVTTAFFGYSEPPSVDQTIDIYLLAASGRVQGGSNFAVSNYSGDTRQEGPVQFLSNKVPGELSRGGGPYDSGYLVIVEDSRVFYDYYVFGPAPSDAQRDAGVNVQVLYRNDFGTSGYYYDTHERTAHFDWFTDHVWERSGMVGAGAPVLFLDAGGPVDYSKPAPDSATICLPVGKAMCCGNGRLLVADGKDRVYFSDYDAPFQFRKAVNFIGTNPDPLSGGSFSIDGQVVQQLVPMGTFAGGPESPGTPLSGAATVFIFTNSNLYNLAGHDSLSLSRPQQRLAHGTLSPFSIARNRDGFYWLDQEGQVRSYGQGGLRNLSLGMVDDITTAIPASRRQWVGGACRSDRYHLVYAEDSSLVWNERMDSWESRDTLGSDETKFLVPFYHEDRTKLVAVSDDGIYEHAKPGEGPTDFRLRTREYSAGFGRKVVVNGCAVLCDSTSSSATINVKRFTPCESATESSPDGSIDIQESTPRVWKIDQPGVGAEGASFYLTIELVEAPPGWRLYSLAVETEQVDAGGPARD